MTQNKLYLQIKIGKSENINKENFWNKCMEFYPKSTGRFCEYIDIYKEEVDWKNVFDDPYIKFHEIPFEFQIGIICKFISENPRSLLKQIKLNKDEAILQICNFFQNLEAQL